MIRKTRWDGEGFNRYIYLPETIWGYPAKWIKLDEDAIRNEIGMLKIWLTMDLSDILTDHYRYSSWRIRPDGTKHTRTVMNAPKKERPKKESFLDIFLRKCK